MAAGTTRDDDRPDVAQHVRRLVDHLPSMLAYWDRDLRCRFANRAYERWFGVNPDALIGTSIRDLLGPQLFALNEPHIRAALAGEEQLFERVVPGPDGVNRHSLANYIPDVVDGQVAGFMVQVTEVTPLKAVEAKLRRQEEQWHELFTQASDGIFIADLQGRYLDVNGAGCRLLGHEREEILGKSITDLIPPAEVDRLAQSKARMLGGNTDVAEWSLRRKDGSYVPVEVSAKILSDGRWIGLVRDITERRRALEATQAMASELERRVRLRTEQLRALAAELEATENRERRQISRDLHDDLGQTLAAARIRLAGLCDEVSEPLRTAVNEIAELVDSANRSTRSLAAQLAPAMLYELGLVPALEWLGEDMARTFGLRVRVDDDGSSKPLSQEARSILYRAARELLINAAKHARCDSATVTVRRCDDRIAVEVSDAGVGFDPLRLGSDPRHGLGLMSVRERLSFVGGTVDVRGIPGDGTVAVLSAPLAVGEPLEGGA